MKSFRWVMRLSVSLTFLLVVAAGQAPPSVMAAIAERDQELRRITDRLLEPRPGSVRIQIEQLRTFAVSRIADLRKLLSHPGSVVQARAMLAEQFGKITLAPTNYNGCLTYAAKGKVDLFAGSRVECAEGQNRTAYAGLFRAALYR
jgi:hypothetical protein